MYAIIAIILGVIAGIAFDKFLLFLIVGIIIGIAAQLVCSDGKRKKRKA